jgi:MFS family permease
MLISAALARLFGAFFFGQAGFNIYWAALPLYFAALGFDPTLIGLLLGTAGVAELVGCLVVGPAIDRLGGRVVVLVGLVCYLVASLGFIAFTAVPALIVLRLIQGFGLAAVIPSTYSFVPGLVKASRQTLAFASIGAGSNVAQALFPALGLTLLERSPSALFIAAALCAALASVIVVTVPAAVPSRRPFGLTFRRGWLMPLGVGILSITQWGVITAFLPLAASEQHANPSLLFTADAFAVLASRVPAGWIADRYGPFRLAFVGVVMMALSPLVLLLPLNDGVLILAGILNGSGAGLTLPPMLSQLTRRSDESRRGTALSYFSVSFAVGMILGSSVGGLLYRWLQFHGLLVVGSTLCLGAVAVLLVDALVWRPVVSPKAVTHTPLRTSAREIHVAPGWGDSLRERPR